MRLGIVRGNVVLQPALPAFVGRRLILVEPVTMENARAQNGRGGGKALVVLDELGAAEGQMVAFTEGREASNPFWPAQVAIDAYCAFIVDSMQVKPEDNGAESEV